MIVDIMLMNFVKLLKQNYPYMELKNYYKYIILN